MDTLKNPSAIILRNFYSAFALHEFLGAERVIFQGNPWRKLKKLLILKTSVTFRSLPILTMVNRL